MKNARESTLVSIAFLVVLSIYILSPVTHFGDMRWVIHIAYNILHGRNTFLDAYIDPALEKDDSTIYRIDGHYYSVYPIGTAVIALPFVAVIDFMAPIGQRMFPGVINSLRSRFASRTTQDLPLVLAFQTQFGKLIASFITALSGVLIYWICRLYLSSKQSFLLFFLYAFCTPAFSTASRALWQHGPSMLMLALGCYLLLSGMKNRASIIQYSSLPLAMAVFIRPLNAISFLIISIFVFIYYRKVFIRFLGWSLVVLIPFLWYNLGTYHDVMPVYYQLGKLAGLRTPMQAFWGTLISPGRGLLVYSPIFLFAFWSLFQRVRMRQAAAIEYFFAAIFLLQLILISVYPHWWGGWSYGPRYMADMVPFLIYFMIPVLQNWNKMRFKRLRGTIFGLAVLISLFMHFQGAVRVELGDWNSSPVDIDRHPERLWDWRDPPFLRNFK